MTPGRWPPTAVFFLNGLVLATYVVRLPSLKIEYGLTDAGLGLIGALFAVSALVSMQFVGPLVARTGSAALLRAALVLLPVLLALVGLSGTTRSLGLSVIALGAVHGVMDAAMNAYAVDVERVAGRPIMSGCHAAWSISAILASLSALPLVHAGVTTTVHFAVAGAVLLVAGLTLGPFVAVLESGPEPGGRPGETDAQVPKTQGRNGSGWQAGWSRGIVLLGLTGMVLMVVDGAALAWGAIFLHDVRGAPLTLATSAVTAYTVGEAGGRVIGDRLIQRFGATRLFRLAGLVGVAGFALLVSTSNPPTAVAGFAVLGLGTSLLLPITFSAVGDVATGAGASVSMSRFTTFTYAGILLGPAGIGWSADLVGLTTTFTSLVPVLAVVVLLSRAPTLVAARTAAATADRS